MGFFSHFTRVIRHVVRQPIKSVAKVIHNPTRAILNKNVRSSKGFRNIGRPIIKIGAAVAIGALTGGIGAVGVGLAAGATSVAVGSSVIAGAIAGGASSALAGGLTNKAFKPIKQLVIPGASGLFAGAGTAFANTTKIGSVGRILVKGKKIFSAASAAKKAYSAIQNRKAIIERMHQQIAASKSNNLSAIALRNKKAELAALQAKNNNTVIASTTLATNKKVASIDMGSVIMGAGSGAAVAGIPGAIVGAIAGSIVGKA